MTKLRFVALALAGALLLTAMNVTSASAYWRGRGWGIAAGLAAGALIGSAVVARPYYGYYGPAYPGYGSYYAAPPYYYGRPIAYAPVAAVPYGYGYGYGYGYYGYYNGYGSGCSGSYGQRRGCAWGDTSR